MSVFRVGSNKSSVNNFPTVRPTLDLDFANSKTLDPRITFTRASGGSYVGADGLIKYAGVNEARFDHDPETGESLGLLIEEGRTNLVQDSEDVFKYSIKVKTNYSLNQIVAPDGTTTADKIYNDTTTGEHYIEDVLSSGLSGNFTHSVFVKAAEYTKVVLRPVHIGESTNTSGCTFDLSNETATTPGGIGSNASIQKFPNGWYRISMTLTLTGANTSNAFRLHLRENESSILNYTGDGTSGFYIWGAQVEAGSFPTSYIPTQGSTRTRQRDDVVITGKNFSDFYRQDEGTVFVDSGLEPSAYVPFQAYLSFTGSTTFDEIRIWRNNLTQATVNHLVGNVSQGAINFPISPASNRIASSYSIAQGISVSANGGAISSANLSATVPATRIRIGARANNTFYGNRTYKRITFWPQRLPDSTLKAITR